MSLVESPTIATYPLAGRRGEIEMCVFQKGECVGVATNIYSGKTLENPKRSLQILKIRVRELFTHGEGISTPRARHKGQQHLIECANHDFKLVYFPFFMLFMSFYAFYFFYLFVVDKGCFPCSYVFLNCGKEIRPT